MAALERCCALFLNFMQNKIVYISKQRFKFWQHLSDFWQLMTILRSAVDSFCNLYRLRSRYSDISDDNGDSNDSDNDTIINEF